MIFLTTAEIAKTTAWLLENASPPVRYLTHRHILKTAPESEEMAALWRAVETSQAAAEIFSAQNADGSWFSGGPWGPRGYRRETGAGYTATRPKFVTTAWLLPYLGEMGFTPADARVRKGCEFILHESGYTNQPHAEAGQDVNCCGLTAIPLRALASVGMAANERLRGEWDWITRCQRSDGGWLNPRHLIDSPTPSQTKGRWPWNRSCAWGSFYAVQALYYAGSAVDEGAFSAALGFMLWHLGQQDSQAIQTWVYHGHNTVKELLMFSEAGLDMSAPPIQALLDWLKGYYRPDEGVFRTQEKPIADFKRHISAIVKDFKAKFGPDYWAGISKTSPPVLRYHLYHLVEDDWLTYYAARIAVNINGAG